MTVIQKQSIDLRDALDKHLNARSLSKSISTLLKSKRKKINFKPDYQRNYVWDKHKATFFIESILLGVEIPPLIMFIPKNDKKTYEVIDGRQRFETLKRFYSGDFKLTAKGLRSLSGLKGLNFHNLDPEIQDTFLNTTIRIIEFSTIGEHTQQGTLEALIKKEIFSRYNSGITPLKTLEVQRAQHLLDNFTGIMEAEFSSNPDWLNYFQQIFFSKSLGNLDNARCQAKIRELLVLENFPINNYASTSARRDTIEWLYSLYIEESDGQEQILQGFIRKIELLYLLFKSLKEKEWMIYQGVYWALVILEQNDIDIVSFFDDGIISDLVVNIKENIDIFTGDERGFSKVTNQRFQNIADFFMDMLEKKNLTIVDFNPYLKSPLEPPKHNQDVADIKESIYQLNTMRLNRPDAVTTTIEDLMDNMGKNAFLIRPAYQRQEVINIKKASGIIESMLLGIPLPSIFIFRRANRVCEVVDGQQRLLSILAFLGLSYVNEKGEETRSKKNNYKLFKKLSILKELGGIKYEDLDEHWQDIIWEFELSVVYIDGNLNKEFDPIDLFIRLNNKPYPVKDHSFEMWNSYSERSIINKIKETELKYRPWFYYRKASIRMENEELLTVFAYLSYQARISVDSVFETVDVYNWAPRPLTFRIPKLLISEWFSSVDIQMESTLIEDIMSSINKVEEFIYKVEILAKSIQNSTVEEINPLESQFNILLVKKGRVRLQKPFYMLWFLLLGIDKKTIENQASVIASEVMKHIENKQIVSKENGKSTKDIFKRNIKEFWAKFN
jgi:hypothetical protein